MTVSNNLFVARDRGALPLTIEASPRNTFAVAFESVLQGLRKHFIVVAAIIVGALVLALLFTLLVTPEYTAISRIEIARESAQITKVEGLEPKNKNQDLEFYETQYALLTARSVAERVAERMGVVSNDRLFDAFDVDVDAMLAAAKAEPGKPKSSAALRLKLAVNLLLGHVSIRPVPGSSLVDVAFKSPSAELSAQVANLWVDEFQQATLDRRFQSTAEARAYLEKRLAELRGKLEDSQRQLVSYAANNQIVTLASDRDNNGNTEASETLRLRDLRTLNDALQTATTQRIAAQSQARQMGGANQNSLSNIALNNMREKRSEVAADLARLRTTFQPEYPVVQALQAQLNELDQSIAREEGRIRNAADASYREAADREASLRQRVGALKADALNEQRASIQYAIFQREVDTNRELYEGLLQRYKEIGVAGAGANNISVVDHALIPQDPASPSLPLNLVLGLLAGIALAAGYVFVREQLDQSIRDPAQVTETFGLALLGTVPEEDASKIRQDIFDPKSMVSEAYFSAASNLSFLTATGVPKSLAFTSTRPNEGKSTTALAMAIALARIGKRVVLIDGDMRNPSLHSFLDMRNDNGLSNLLSSAGDALRANEFCVPTPYGIDFVPAGPIPPNPGALLSNEQLGKVVHRLGDKYDVVLLDGPPLLGLADAPLAAKAVEGVIYAIEANGVRLRAIQAGLRRLQFAEVPVFGAVVTKLNSSNAAYGYGYGYGYGYSYGSKDAKA